MRKRTIGLIAGVGCIGLLVVFVLFGVLAFRFYDAARTAFAVEPTATGLQSSLPSSGATQEALPTLPPAAPAKAVTKLPTPNAAPRDLASMEAGALTALYQELNPGVVNIRVTTAQGGGTGSGFLIDDQGHIVTNNHVVAGAQSLLVVYHDGHEAVATLVGTDDDSDIAVIKVEDIPQGVHPLRVGDSDKVQAGEWVIAIGSPFGLGSTMTLGIVSAKGRTIPSGVTPFSIPEAIQTDAAINPGNSGGPLLNLDGEVIGVNAQIASEVRANAGVGFAIPANVVRRVAPVLIAEGIYEWPWLGVSGGSVGLAVQQANRLPTQQGAYIDSVISGGPADQAGLVGSQGTRTVDGHPLPVGGDIVLAIDGVRVDDFNKLLTEIASHQPGDRVRLTVLRSGREGTVTVELAGRPQDFSE